MNVWRFLRLMVMTVIVGGCLVGIGFDYKFPPFIIALLIVMNIYYWLDHRIFGDD